MRPQRKITERDGFYTIEHSSEWFFTTDHVLAEAVRAQLDLDDSLPCPHLGDVVEVTRLGDPGQRYLCQDCGEAMPPLPFSGRFLNAAYIERMRRLVP